MSDHFEKTPENKKSELRRTGNYRQTCKDVGHGFNSSIEKRSEVHHVLCDHSIAARIKDYKSSEIASYIEDCLWITDWDINNKDNLFGLPRNRQFKECYGVMPESMWEPQNLPSHMVDHNTADGYTFEVRKWLMANIWDTIHAQKTSHNVDAEKIKEQLENGSKHFLALLKKRGLREQGTKMGWKLRHDKGYERRWYQPFSMGKKPSYRHTGVSGTDLTKIFKKLG